MGTTLLRRAFVSLMAILVLSGTGMAAAAGLATHSPAPDPPSPADLPTFPLAAMLPGTSLATPAPPASRPLAQRQAQESPGAAAVNPIDRSAWGALVPLSAAAPLASPEPSPSAPPSALTAPAAARSGGSGSGVRYAPEWPLITNRTPLPPCRIADVATPLAGYDDWSRTLVDQTYSVPSDYVPPDLVSAGPAGFYSGYLIRAVALPDLEAMSSAARSAGAPLGILSSYRDYSTQIYTFWHWVNQLGQWALISSARPGHSEHQLGLAIDFQSAGGPEPWAYSDFAKQTTAGAWLAANAWHYGFVMSYPLAKSPAVTCYGYEPWHYRYVGRAEAAALHSSGLSLRELLWQRQPDQSRSAASPATSATPPIATPTPAPSVPTVPASAVPESILVPLTAGRSVRRKRPVAR
jgi:LAS superfamily LD-carboxypeptidase LdcB